MPRRNDRKHIRFQSQSSLRVKKISENSTLMLIHWPAFSQLLVRSVDVFLNIVIQRSGTNLHIQTNQNGCFHSQFFVCVFAISSRTFCLKLELCLPKTVLNLKEN